MLETLFVVVNLIPMPYWLLMIFLPRHPYTRRLTSGWAALALLGVIYTVLLFGSVFFSGSMGNDLVDADLLSLDGLAALMATPLGTLIAWTHLLALDLFAGVWIYQECQRTSVSQWLAGIFLFFTLMSGPFGLLLFLLWRGRQSPVHES